MKSIHKYICFLFLLTGFVHVNGQAVKPDTEDFSQISAKELDEAFIIAVKNGDLEEVKKLIQAGANVNQELTYIEDDYDSYHDVTCTALDYAAGHGYTDIVKELMLAELTIDDISNALIFA